MADQQPTPVQPQPQELSVYDRIKLGLLKVGRKAPPELRFWSRVDKDGPEHPTLGKCWVWLGYLDRDGYGQFSIQDRPVRAHRYSYALLVGEVPDELCVLHHCDNPRCVNPGHLFLGTVQDNNADMVAKGHYLKGQDHGRAKLTEDQVRAIRQRYKPRSKTDGALAMAKELGVYELTIRLILARKIWTHLE